MLSVRAEWEDQVYGETHAGILGTFGCPPAAVARATNMGAAAGRAEIAEPPSLVAEGIIEALRAGDFHVFPDSTAQQIGGAYKDFAENVVEAPLSVA